MNGNSSGQTLMWVGGGLILLALLLLPLATDSTFLLHLVTMVFLYGYMAQAWNIAGGYAGQFSVGHAAFVGIGAYVATLGVVDGGWPLWLAVLMSVLIVALVAGIIAGAATRLRGIFFAMTTVALAEILRALALHYRGWTGGALGLYVPDYLALSRTTSYYITLTMLVAVTLLSYWLSRSRWGYYFRALRDDPEGAQSIGINVNLYKLLAVQMSAALTGLAGVVYAFHIMVVDPFVVFGFNLSIRLVIITVVGGISSVVGPLIGAVLTVIPDELIRGAIGGTVAGAAGFIYGVLLILVMLFFPGGFVGLWKSRTSRRRQSGTVGGSTHAVARRA